MPIYSFPELKGKIRVGNTVIHEGEKKKVTDAGTYHFTLDYVYHHPYDIPNRSLELLEEPKTLDTVDVGDAVFNSIGRAYVILDTSKNGTILFLSNNESGLYDFSATRAYLKKACFTVKQPSPEPEITEMTVEEAEAKLSTEGKKVKIIQE